MGSKTRFAWLAKGNAMLDRAIEVMKIELECVKQNVKCNQSCEECNLIYKCDELVEVYEWIINELEWKKQLQLVNKPAEDALINWYKEKYGW